MKPRSAFLLFTTLIHGLFAIPTASAQPTTLRAGSPFPENHVLAAGTRAFLNAVESKSNGRIKFQRFWAGTLVKPAEALESTSKGVVDVVTGLWIYDPGKIPLGSFEYNFIFNDPRLRTQSKIKREMYAQLPELNDELAKFNIAPALQFGSLTSYDLIARKPIKTLDDLRGLRIAHTPTEYVPVFSAVGAVSVVMPAGEMYQSLERGVVDAVALPLELMYAFKLHEVAKNHMVTGISTPAPISLWVNMGTWKKLTATDQKLFIDAGKESEQVYLTNLETHLAQARQQFDKSGVITVNLSDADKTRWAANLPEVPAQWAEKMESIGLPGWRIVEKYMDLSSKEGWQFPRKWRDKK
jgi:TRAP-type C4-dicarboxylate transport system substrate-binding protein